MRGLVEPRSLAAAITRARGPSSIRTLSGIGRGQGDGRESGTGRGYSHDDADEPLFTVGGGGYGHGAPLNSNSGGGSRPVFPLGEAADQNAGLHFGNTSADRGLPPSPLLPNISLGRGSPLQRPSEGPLFSDRKPSLSLGLGGFGRGKPAQNAASQMQPEDPVSGEHRRVLPKWEDNLKRMQQKESGFARGEERKLFGEDRTDVLGYPGSSTSPSMGGSGPGLAREDNFSSRSTQQPPRPTYGFAQPLRSPNQGRPAPLEQQGKLDKIGGPAQSFISSTAQEPWQYTAASKATGQGWQPAPSDSSHRAMGQPPATATSRQPFTPRAPVSENGESYNAAIRQSPSSQIPTSEQVAAYYVTDRQNPLMPPASAMSARDTTKAQPYYSAGRQVPPRFAASATGEADFGANRQAPAEPFGSGRGESRQAPPRTFSASQSREPPYDTGRQPIQSTFSAMGITQKVSPMPYTEESYYQQSAGRQVPASASGEAHFSANRQAPPKLFGSDASENTEPLYDTGRQPFHSTFSEMGYTQNVPPTSYDEYEEVSGQPDWSTMAAPEPVPTDFEMGQWYYGGTPQETLQEFSSTQEFPYQTQGQDLDNSGSWQPSWSASPTAEHSGDYVPPPANDYYNDWGGQPSESTGHYSDYQQFSAEAPLYPEVGLDYDARIEECSTQGKWEDIDAIYGKMKAAKVRASAKTYDTLMQTYMKLGKLDRVSQVYQEMRDVIMPGDGTNKTEAVRAKEETKRTAVNVGEKFLKPAYFEESTEQAGYAAFTSEQTEYAAPEQVPYFGDEFQTLDNTVEEGAQAYGQEAGSSMPGYSSKQSTPFKLPDVGAQARPTFRAKESAVGRGAGRGKRVESFFDFPGSEGSALGRENFQVDQEPKSERSDEYSETFRPVIQPEFLYAFAPQGLSPGPGIGRGRPSSPQAFDSAIGVPSSPESYSIGVGRGKRLYPQHAHTPLQTKPPFYAEGVSSEPRLDHRQEKARPQLSQQEAGDRAIEILEQRLRRRFQRMEEWSKDDVDQRVRSERRASIWMPHARAPKEKRELRKHIDPEIEVTAEEAEKEVERLKAMQNNEKIEELQRTLSQFMKAYGEMGLELEYHMGDFMTNPDIDEKPLPPLEEYLEKAKPNIMKTGIIRSENEWQRMVKDVLNNASYFEEFVERHSGPGRYTAKQENEDLEEIANTLPSDVGPKLQSLVQRSLTTLKSNPGMNLDEKQWMLANMVDELSQYQYGAT